MPNPFLAGLVTPHLPRWWRERVTVESLLPWLDDVREEWEESETVPEVSEVTFRAAVQDILADTRHPASRRLASVVALCLARLAPKEGGNA